MSTKLVMT